MRSRKKVNSAKNRRSKSKHSPLVPLWGSNTQKAVENFPVSGKVFPREFIESLAQIKSAAAEVNHKLKKLSPVLSKAIIRASKEIESGKHDLQFPVDIFQTGSGTSTNMNMNEVVANLAGHNIHPNDHVNMGQSSNDVIPSAIHMTVVKLTKKTLLPALLTMEEELKKKSREFKNIQKTGRTHLQDAVPLSLGEEFSAYATQIEKSIRRIESTLPDLYELALGGTAVGTGLNTHPKFGTLVIEKLSSNLKIPFKKALNPFEAQACKDSCVYFSSSLKSLAVSLFKIGGDLRLLSSGPNCGIGELELPSLQPGSSIMPGKVNPVMIESLLQVCSQVIGNDLTVTMCGMNGQLELNAMMPTLANNIFESIHLLSNVCTLFTDKCLKGIKPRKDIIKKYLEKSLLKETTLATQVGYEKAVAAAEKLLHQNDTSKNH